MKRRLCPLTSTLIVMLVCIISRAAEPKEVVETLWEISGDHVEWFLASPDGSSVAVAIRSTGVTVFKDNVRVGTYQNAVNPFFSSNSRSFAFLAIDSGKVFFVVDGRPLPPLNIRSDASNNPQLLAFSTASAAAFNFDGTAFAYRDVVGSAPVPSENSRLFTLQDQAIFVNGNPEAAHPEVGQPVFSPVKNELIYRVRDNGIKQAYLVRPGVASGKYVTIMDPVLFNSNGTRVAFIAQADFAKFLLVIDGVEQPDSYDFAYGLTFSPDGKRIAFVAGQPGTNQFVVIDGKRGPAFKHVDPVTFSLDGSRYGYIANTNLSIGAPGQNETIVVIDGSEVARQKDARAFGPFFGPKGKVAFVIQAGVRFYLTIDGERQGPYAYAGFPIFSGTGSHIAYAAVDGISNKLKMVVDGVASPHYAAVSIPRFTGESKVEYYAIKAGPKLSVVRVIRTF